MYIVSSNYVKQSVYISRQILDPNQFMIRYRIVGFFKVPISNFLTILFSQMSLPKSAIMWSNYVFKGLNFINDQHPCNSRNLYTSKNQLYGTEKYTVCLLVYSGGKVIDSAVYICIFTYGFAATAAIPETIVCVSVHWLDYRASPNNK